MDLVPARRFELFERIGRGGFADIHRAHQIGLRGFRRTVAVKVLRPEVAADPRHIDRLVREARLGATLDHPNLVETLDLVMIDGRPSIVTGFIDGMTLHDALGRLERVRAPMPFDAAVFIALEVLAGLSHGVAVHGPGFFHGDLNPANLLLSRHGEVRIIDLGVASTTPEPGLRGKPGYLPPEVLRGEAPDHRADLFAVAIALWESLAGRRLFPITDPREALDAILPDRLAARLGRAPRVSKLLLPILTRALSPRPDDRQRDARELAHDLALWAATERHLPRREALVALLSELDALSPTELTEVPEPPPLPPMPSARVDLSDLEDALSDLDDSDLSSRFAALATGTLDDQLERWTRSLGTSTDAPSHAFVPLGTLDPVTLPSLVAALSEGRHTGVLRVIDRDRRKAIAFEAGRVVACESNLEAELLGKRLVRTGVIATPIADSAIVHAHQRGLKVGEALIELGALSPDRLHALLDAQIVERFVDLFAWPEGRITFERGHTLSTTDPRTPRKDGIALIAHAVATAWPAARIAEWLAPLAALPIRWTAQGLREAPLFPRHLLADPRLGPAFNGRPLSSYLDGEERSAVSFATLVLLGHVRLGS